MKRNRRILPVMILIVMVLLVALFAQNNTITNNEQSIQPTPQIRRVFPELAVLDILALRVEDPYTGETFTIARETDGTWIGRTTDSDGPMALQDDAGTFLARTTVLLGYTQTINVEPDRNLGEFGFLPRPQLLISVVAANDEQHIVAVGNPLQTGPYYYIAVDDRPELYIADRAAIDNLAATLNNPPLFTEEN